MKKLLLAFAAMFTLSASVQAQQGIINGDFEDWDISSYDEVDSPWISSNFQSMPDYQVATVSKVTGHNSNFAIRLETKTDGTDTIPAFISNSLDDIISGEGGIPFSGGIPTTLNGYARYSLTDVKDTAFLLCIFKTAGAITSFNMMQLRGSQTGFVPFTMPLQIPGQAPDTVIFAVTIGNVLEDIYAAPGSWIELDGLSLTTTTGTAAMPGGDFEDWTTVTTEDPQGWEAGFGFSEAGNVTRSTDKFTGDYALRLESVYSDNMGMVSPGFVMGAGFVGAPQAGFSDSLIGYYKYSTPNGDIGMAAIQFMDAQGATVGTPVSIEFDPTATYKRFAVSLTNRPDDAMAIMIMFSSADLSMLPNLLEGGVLHVDELSIKRGPTSVGEVKQQAISIFPNPAHDVVNITGAEGSSYIISNVAGVTVGQGKLQTGAVNISSLVPGSYNITLQQANGNVRALKFQKQ